MQPTDERSLQRAGVRAIVSRTYHQVIRHRVVDAAASLTFFATLTAFPTALAVVSVLSLLDSKGDGLSDLIQIIGVISRPETAEHLEQPLRQLTSLDNPWLGFGIGVLLTLWSLSGYATAFGRAMNTVYEVEEGRRIWKFRGMMLLVTLLIMVGGAIVIAILLISPAVASAIASQMQWPSGVVWAWDLGKWPVLAATLVVMVAVLYYATPNVKTPRRRWVTVGAGFAIGIWALATLGFAIYVETIGGQNKAYGWLGGAILMLLYIFVSNFVLVVGGELDSEIVRVRQLFAGIDADDGIRLPLRDVARNFTLARWRDNDIAAARQLRLAAEQLGPRSRGDAREDEKMRELASELRVGERPMPKSR
jgi:membrane protein